MATWDDFKDTKESKMWKGLRDVAEQLNINENTHASYKDIPEFWEPFLERLFKLAVFYKYQGKIKELKMDWIRPMYICTNLENQRIRIEDRDYIEAIKENVYLCGDIFQAFRPFIVTLYDYDKLDKLDKGQFKKKKKEFQDQLKKLFVNINKFVKTGYRNIQEVMYLILKPIIDLVNANYELFCMEAKLAGIKDMTIFMDKKDLTYFMENLKKFYEEDETKLKRDLEKEKVDEFLKNTESKFNYEYSLGDDLRDNKEVRYDFCNFRHEALQKKFEGALTGLLEYLYVRRKEDFDYRIDVHKMFQNIKLPDVDKIVPLKFYVRDLKHKLSEMKRDLYNMKINGISRIKIPVSANKEFLDKLYLIYREHIVIDRLIGDKLRYDQYIFLYECIKFIYDSSVREILLTKDDHFKEDILPKHVILMALRAQMKTINSLREECVNKKELFSFKNYFQMVHMELEANENQVLNAWDITPYKSFLTGELNTRYTMFTAEKEKIGRFWMLENFIPPQDRELWYEALEMLRNINELVVDDIRDYILNIAEVQKKEKMEKLQKEKDKENQKEKEKDHRKLPPKQQSSIKNLPTVGKEREKSAKRSVVRAESKGRTSDFLNSSVSGAESEDEFEFTKKKKEKVVKKDNFRPPYVWNFPIDKIKIKDEDPRTHQIRVVDPRTHYIDGRVVKFLDLIQKMKDNMLNYSKSVKGEIWKYFTERIFVIFNVTNSGIMNERD